MLTIGRFAQMSGLSVKALRHYDEKGLLEPQQVDTATGYRMYGAQQLRRAASIRMLRATGMSLEQVGDALAAPDRRDALITRFCQTRAQQRAQEDAAVAEAIRVLHSYDEPVRVQTRSAPEQHWVGVVHRVDLAAVDAEQGAQEANHAFGLLARALHEAGNPPTGSFWTTIRNDESGSGGELVLCWPVAQPAAAELALEGARIEHGTLPEREESFVLLRFDDDEPIAGDVDGPPPAPMLALVEHGETAYGEDVLIRQVGVLGPEGMPIGVEVTVTALSPSPRRAPSSGRWS